MCDIFSAVHSVTRYTAYSRQSRTDIWASRTPSTYARHSPRIVREAYGLHGLLKFSVSSQTQLNLHRRVFLSARNSNFPPSKYLPSANPTRSLHILANNASVAKNTITKLCCLLGKEKNVSTTTFWKYTRFAECVERTLDKTW